MAKKTKKNNVHENSKAANREVMAKKPRQRQVIIDYIRANPGSSREGIYNGLRAQGIPIHYSTVSSHVSGLKKAGQVEENGTSKNSSGRSAAKLYEATADVSIGNN
jgi:Fe2+ or Zn2+ uptake regulation protein